MCQKLRNKTHLNGKRGHWLWLNHQFRYFRDFMKRQRHLHVLKKRQRHLEPLAQRHRSWERRDKATRLPPLEGLLHGFSNAMSCSIIARYIYWIVTGMQLLSIVFGFGNLASWLVLSTIFSISVAETTNIITVFWSAQWSFIKYLRTNAPSSFV